jgi:hypothetical protein
MKQWQLGIFIVKPHMCTELKILSFHSFDTKMPYHLILLILATLHYNWHLSKTFVMDIISLTSLPD